MWERFKRWVRSIFGGAIESVEDPEKILRQNIRDMNDQVPKMNESIAMIKANVTLVSNRQRERAAKIEQLKAKIKAALQANRRDIALNYATTLEQINQDYVGDEQQLKINEEAYDKAIKVKEAFLLEKKAKVEEAQRAIAKHKQAEWQKKVADAMESFSVAGVDQTHDEMIERINRESAMNQARMEMALDNIDVAGIEIEKEAQALQANELLKQFEMELGLKSPEPVAEKSLGPGEEALAEVEAEIGEEVAKTVGPKKVKQ
ncbi:MAG TPA: PspA/IM30 family protein [bacterium]|nr:PspA/IM30 family protein [bacterium]